MTKIKICGLKNLREVAYVNQLKPDYIGLVFVKKSKRYVSLDQAKDLIKNLDRGIKKVGVFLDQDIKEVEKIDQACNLDVLQFHGREDKVYIDYFPKEIWKVLVVKKDFNIDKIKDLGQNMYLLDSFDKKARGGTGRVFDWNLVKGLPGQKMVLAGGLNPSNVKQAIEKLNPAIVDVSSGVEKDNKKDFKLIESFIKKVRSD